MFQQIQNEKNKLLRDKTYLGDGVYAGHDSVSIIIWVEQESFAGPGAIVLEPQVLKELNNYKERMGL